MKSLIKESRALIIDYIIKFEMESGGDKESGKQRASIQPHVVHHGITLFDTLLAK